MSTERYNLTIKDLPSDERPRERLVKYGPGALSNSELLAIILRVGTRAYSAIGLAEHMISQFNGLRGIATASIHELSKIPGLGTAKAAQIQAMVELGKRLSASVGDSRDMVRSPEDAANRVMPFLRDEPQENFRAIYLNVKHEVIKEHTCSIGSVDASLIAPRELFRTAISCNCYEMIVAHNHPSGDPSPSKVDIDVTKRLVQSGQMLGMEVLDHIIVGDGRWVSMKDRGLM